MKNKVMKAAVRYLEIRGYEVLQQDDDEIFAYDPFENEISLAKVSFDTDHLHKLEDNTMSRKSFEKKIEDFLMSHDDYINVGIRFDSIVLSVIGSNRAIVKHYINAGLED